MIPVFAKMAARSLTRNVRRTALSVAGIAIGCALAVMVTAFVEGASSLLEGLAVEGGLGHLEVVPADYLPARDKTLRLAAPEEAAAAARALPGVVAVSARTRVDALLAMGIRVAGVELLGVTPEAEPALDRAVRKIARGRYLTSADEGAIVIGERLAERLVVDVDDELVVTAVRRDGAIESALLRVIGIARSGSREVDGATAQVTLADAARLSGGGTGEIAILLDRGARSPEARAALAGLVRGGDQVLGWKDLTAMDDHVEQDRAVYRFVSWIVTLMVLFGLAGAQITSALERRREFAVLGAVGMGSGHLAAQLVLEAVALGLVGAVAALALAVPANWYLATHGIDLSRLVEQELSFEGFVMAGVLYTDFGPWMVTQVVALALVATLLASIYPAWFAARTDPADALRVAP